MDITIRNGMLFAGALGVAAAGWVIWFFPHDEVVQLEPLPALQWNVPPSPVGQQVETPLEDDLDWMALLELDEEELVELEEGEEWPPGMVPGEILLTFASQAELDEFVRAARQAGLSQIDIEAALGVVRLRELTPEQARLARMLAGDAALSYNPYVMTPEVPPLEGADGRARPFGDRALDWLGVPPDNADWGRGVTVAVLDTGVAPHPSLAHLSPAELSLLSEAERVHGVGTHGTAVASILAGSGDGVRGISPGVNLMSIQVLDAQGVGSGFGLAQGIVQAVDAGAQVINLSLGTTVHSEVLENAVRYAQNNGVIIVAAAGNSGDGQIMFPARYPGVIGVGAVDFNAQHASFSNRGYELAISAPGVGLNAASGNGAAGSYSGTSFAAPLVSGAAAALLSQEPHLTSSAVVDALLGTTNDVGPPGHDGYYGQGVLDVGRAMQRNQPNIIDVAIADHFLDFRDGFPVVYVTVQNQGTVRVTNVFLEVSISGQQMNGLLGQLEVGEVKYQAISLAPFFQGGAQSVTVSSHVSMPGVQDSRPFNNSHTSTIRFNPDR